MSWIDLPSRITLPLAGGSSRASARSAVLLPQPFGPISTLTFPSGMVRVRSVAMTVWS